MGWAMSAFCGGSAECRIRKAPVPVRLVDFTSTYPTLLALMMWTYVTDQQITDDESASVTSDVERLLTPVSVDGCFDPSSRPPSALTSTAGTSAPIHSPRPRTPTRSSAEPRPHPHEND